MKLSLIVMSVVALTVEKGCSDSTGVADPVVAPFGDRRNVGGC